MLRHNTRNANVNQTSSISCWTSHLLLTGQLVFHIRVKSMLIHFTGQPKTISPLKKNPNNNTKNQTTAASSVETKNGFLIIFSKKMLQLSGRTMFLWFYRAILPLLVLVGSNLENIVELPIQTSKPNYKRPKEKTTAEQRCGKCDQ